MLTCGQLPGWRALCAEALVLKHGACCLCGLCRYGGWGRFQELLNTLKGVADKHGTSLQVSRQCCGLSSPAAECVVAAGLTAYGGLRVPSW